LWNQVTWQSWTLLGWTAIVLGQCTRIICQHRSLNRLLLQTRPADEQLTGLVRETAIRLGLRQPLRTVLTDQDCSPFVCGIRRPTLVLPGNLLTALSASELTQVLLHELAHIRRLDLVWGWIGEGLRVVYFFHPAAHWISYRLRLERELACDSIAMSLSDQGPAAYAATLVNVISHASAPSVFKTSAVSAGLRGESR
jgi:beta-lactamase regulating signal transducer with metallopeptidase domain